MGLLILERKEWLSKYEEAKSMADSAELNFKRERASHASDMTAAKRREDSLKKALGIEKECVKNVLTSSSVPFVIFSVGYYDVFLIREYL